MISRNGNGEIVISKDAFIPVGLVIVLLMATAAAVSRSAAMEGQIDLIDYRVLTLEQFKSDADTRLQLCSSMGSEISNIKDDIEEIKRALNR